jgi:hypothetical protein
MPNINPPNVHAAAAYKFAIKVLEKLGSKPDVGRHDFGELGLSIIIDCGKLAMVDRGPGKNGDGLEVYAGKGLGISVKALLRFLTKSGALAQPNAVALLTQCLIDDMDSEEDVEDLMPEEVKQAQEKIAELYPDRKNTRRTAARCLGIEGAKVRIKVKQARAAKPKPHKRRVA